MPFSDPCLLEPGIAVAINDGHFIASLCAPPSPSMVARLGAYVRRHSPQPARFCYYLRVGAGASPPDEATRAKLRELGAQMTPRMAGVSAIIEIPGFVGAAVRSVVTGMGLVFGRAVKVRASSNARDAAAVVAPILREAGLVPLDAASLEASLATLRSLG